MKAAAWPSGPPPKLKISLKDCAVENKANPELHNYMILSSASNMNNQPNVVDMERKPVVNRSVLYPGAMIYASVNIYSYNMDVSKGVTAGLNGVMVTGEEGPLGRLDNKPTAEQMFADVAAAPTAGAPTAGAPTAGAPAPGPGAPAPAPASAPVMTSAAEYTYDQYIDSGWTNEQLIASGFMVPPAA